MSISVKTYNQLIISIIILGIGFRIFHFLYNRSLWMDEVYLATSLVKMNLQDLLTSPLYYQQKAPIGFLAAVKLAENLFGNKEYGLRIIPLLSGITSIFLFGGIAKHYLSKPAVILAMAIFCFSPALVYHSVEVKQYATELLCTLLVLQLYLKYNHKLFLKERIFYGIAGAIVIWFSYSSIFILASAGLIGLFTGFSKRDWKETMINCIPYTLWAFSFLVNYLIFTHKHAESDWIKYWFDAYHNFMPFPPRSISDLSWFPINIYRMLDYPLGLLWNFNVWSDHKVLGIIMKAPFIPLGLLATGSYYLLTRKNKADNAILILSISLTLIASGLKLYPLTGRFWVFLSPILILILSYGLDWAHSYIKNRNALSIVLILMIIPALVQSIGYIIKPETFYIHKKSDQRAALAYINDHFQKDDAVYVYWNNQPGYLLYQDLYHFNYKAIEGLDYRNVSDDFQTYNQHLKADFEKFSGSKRVWLVYNTQFLTTIGDKIDEPKWYYKDRTTSTNNLVTTFEGLGKLIDKVEYKDITICIFDISKRK